MKPLQFKQATHVLAKDQPEYLPLPVYCDEQETISCWTLTLWERLTLLVSGKIWLRQLTFDRRLQPQLPQVTNPFK